MADSVYDLAVKLSLETAGLAGAAGLALRAFGGIEGQARAADVAVANLNRRAAMVNMTGAQRQAFLYSEALGAQTAAHDKLNTAMKGTALLMGGAALVGVGAGLFGFMDKAVKRAEDLQTIMVQVQAATQATPGQMASLQSLAVTQGLRTQFSLNEEAGLIAAMTRAGIAGPGSVGRIQQMLPAISTFAEVMKMGRGTAPTESATTAVELAHLYGQYDALGGKKGPGVNYMVELAGKALAVTPASGKEFETLISQFASTMRPLYGDNKKGFVSDSIALAMLESQLGQQSRGGLQVGSLITRTLGGTSKRSSQQNEGLARLSSLAGGRQFFDDKGQFAGIGNALSIMEQAAASKDETPKQIGLLFKQAFGAVGARQAGILADPVTVGQFGKVGQYLDPKTGGVSMDKIREAYNATPEGQQAKAVHNWETLTTLIGQRYVPAVTAALGVTAAVTGALANLANVNPGLTNIVAGVIGVTAAVTALSGAILIGRGAFLLWGAAGEALGLAKLASGINIITAAMMAQGRGTIFATVATRAWAEVQAAGAAYAAAGAGVYALLDASVIALSGGFSIATIAAGLLDLSLLPVTLTVVGIGVAVGAVVYAFTHWGQVTGFVVDQLKSLKAIADAILHGNYDAGFGALSHSIGGKSPVNPVNAGQDLGAWTRHTLHLDELGRFLFSPSGGGASPEHWIPAQAGATQGLAGVVPAHLLTPLAGAPRLPAAFALPPLLAVPPLPARAPAPLVAPLPASSASAAHVQRGPTPVSHMHGDTHLHFGPSSIVVNGAQGQDVRQLAKLVAEEVHEMSARKTREGSQYQATQFTGLELDASSF